MSTLYYESSFAHHGIRGMKWGIRRYQNKDGTLTPRGQKRYQKEMEKITRDQNVERRRIALEQAKVREARKTEQAKLKLQKEKEGLAEDKDLVKGKKPKITTEADNKSKQKPVSEMTNAEIKSIIERVDLEKKLNAIVNPPKTQSAFEKWAIDTAGAVGKTMLTKIAENYGSEIGKRIAKSSDDGSNNQKKDKKNN